MFVLKKNDKNVSANGLSGGWTQEAQMKIIKIKEGRGRIRGMLMSSQLLWAMPWNLSEELCGVYLRIITPDGLITHLFITITTVWPLGNINFTALTGWFACGSIEMGQGNSGWDLNSIYYTVQFPYQPEHPSKYTLPIFLVIGLSRVPRAEYPIRKCID